MRRLAFAMVLCIAGAPFLLAAESEKPDHHAQAGEAKAAQASARVQKTCPVSGKPVNKNTFIEYEGQKVYFCCNECPAKFKASPEKHLPALYRQIYPQRVQVTCPVMGEAIDGKTFIDFKGQRVGFCCDDCPPKFKAHPGKYAAELEATYTDQVHDPVTGQAIDPQLSIEHQGKTVYFSSSNAMKEFEAHPAKYADKLLPQVGVLARGATADQDIVLCAVVAPDKAVHERKDVQTAVYEGKIYFLASADDAKAFKADPGKYAKAVAGEMKTRGDHSDHWFTCSMHPDALQKGPGECPICGMKLTPVKPAAANQEHAPHK